MKERKAGVYEIPVCTSITTVDKKQVVRDQHISRESVRWEREDYDMRLSEKKVCQKKRAKGKARTTRFVLWDNVITLDFEPSPNERRRNRRGTCRVGSPLL